MQVTTAVRIAVRIAVLLAAGARAASGQRIRGTLRDSATGAPIAGAVVWATDSAGRFLARSVSVDSGAFAVPRLNGAAQLHVLRIGYRPRDLPAPADTAESLVVRMVAVPLELAAVEARGARVCPGERASAAALELWSQVRSALYASVVAREANPPRITMLSYTKTLEPVRHTVIDDSMSTKDLVADAPYVAARPAWSFASEGYMTETSGERTFYAPDADVLLDSSFAATHCLRNVPADRRHPDAVGVAFDPIDTRGRDTLVDIAGVLWLDPRRAALQSIDFTYTGLEPAASDRSGGEVVFTVNAHGAPMVSRWEIRSVELATDDPRPLDPVRHRPPPRAERIRLHVVHEFRTGGQLLSIVWASDEGIEGAAIAGTVSDENGRSVRGARVWIADRSDTVVTDAQGRFAIAGVVPGHYVAMAADSALAAIGVGRAAQSVDVRTGAQQSVQLLYLDRASVMSRLCPSDTARAVMLAYVVTPSGAPIEGAQVDVYADSVEAGRVPRRSATTNAQGYASACGIPVGRRYWVRARWRSGAAVSVVDVAAADVTPVRVVIKP